MTPQGERVCAQLCLRQDVCPFGAVHDSAVWRGWKLVSAAHPVFPCLLNMCTAAESGLGLPCRLRIPPACLPATGERFEKVKLQRTEPALIKTVPGLFATVLYVDNLHAVSWALQLAGAVLGVYAAARQ